MVRPQTFPDGHELFEWRDKSRFGLVLYADKQEVRCASSWGRSFCLLFCIGNSTCFSWTVANHRKTYHSEEV